MNERNEHEERLDELLERAGDVGVPPGLAADTKRGLAAARADLRLERLLERVPAPEVPGGLSARVLAGLEEERRPRRRRLAPVLVAAAVVLALGVFVATRGGAERGAGTTELARVEPEPELLVALDALENWDLLTSEDVDLLLAGLDVADLTLLELAAEEAESNGGSAETEDGGKEKG